MTKKPVTGARGRRQSGMASGKAALLNAAINHFARYSFDASSLRAIAREAEVDVALCARLFGNKAGLWQAVIDALADKYEQDLKEPLADIVIQSQTEPLAALKALIELYTEHCVKNPAFPAFFIQESISGSGRIDVIREQLSVPLMAQAVQVVARAKAAGVIHCANPIIYMRMLASSISFTLTTSGQLPESTLAEGRLKERILEEAFQIFLH